MARENRYISDIRGNLILGIISGIAVLLYKSELSFAIALAASLSFVLLQGQYRRALRCAAAYLMLFLLSALTAGRSVLTTVWLFATIARHLLIPLSFLQGISDRSTGELLEVCHKLHLPKSLGISSIVFMRFLPTIRYELQAIRGALKFRGIGLSLVHTLCHLPKNFHLTLIPLLIRTVRLSDEITAAALTRGMDLDSRIVSLTPVKWTKYDTLSLVVLSVVFASLKAVELTWGWAL